MQKRFLYNELVKYLDHKNALVITGMRQVGKTTLMRQIFNDIRGAKLWFDFDNPLDMLLFEDEDYGNIYQTLLRMANREKPVVFIDEIQNFPEITKIMKYHIDHFGLKYIVTGSSNFYLKNLFPESLSGRKFLFVLRPLDFWELVYFRNLHSNEDDNQKPRFEDLAGRNFRDYKKLQRFYDEYLEFGGFPEVVTTEDHNTKSMVLKNIFASFFEKDLKLLSDIKDIRELRNLILLLVPRTGNMIDITRLASELGISRIRTYEYLEFLQGAFFLQLIPKFSASIYRSVAGGRKIYFSDTGLLNIIGKVNDGQLFENGVANQLSIHGELSFYNRRNTAEIDFILNREVAFEVKLKATEADYPRVKILAAGIGINKSFVISKSYTEKENILSPVFI